MFVQPETIRTYSEIDGLHVIEETLLFKGTDGFRDSMTLPIRLVEHMAHIAYGLTVNPTNKLYVGMYLDKFYKRHGLLSKNGSIKIPKEIFDKVDAIHKTFQTEKNKNIEL